MRHEGAYGWLVGSAEKVMMVLKDDGRHYSAAGYGPRMAETVGTFYLGQDDVGPYDGHAELGQAVNDAVEKHLGDERSAYALARDTAIAYLDKLHAASQLLPKAQGASVDLLELARYVMAALCGAWFGLPDGKLMRYGGRADDLRNLDDDDGIAHCPGDLMAISRYVFGPHPQEDPVATRARVLGERVKHAFAALVARPLDQQTPLVRDIMQLADGAPSRQAALVAGVMLGFPAPTIGSLAAVLVNWSITRELWRLQQSLAVPAAADFPRAEFTLANDILRQPLLTRWPRRRRPTQCGAAPRRPIHCRRRTEWAARWWSVSRRRCVTRPCMPTTSPSTSCSAAPVSVNIRFMRPMPAPVMAWRWAPCWGWRRRCCAPVNCATRPTHGC